MTTIVVLWCKKVLIISDYDATTLFPTGSIKDEVEENKYHI
jgi:hypothetical protein